MTPRRRIQISSLLHTSIAPPLPPFLSLGHVQSLPPFRLPDGLLRSPPLTLKSTAVVPRCQWRGELQSYLSTEGTCGDCVGTVSPGDFGSSLGLTMPAPSAEVDDIDDHDMADCGDDKRPHLEDDDSRSVRTPEFADSDEKTETAKQSNAEGGHEDHDASEVNGSGINYDGGKAAMVNSRREGYVVMAEDAAEEQELTVKTDENQLVGKYQQDTFACLNLMRRAPIEKFSKLRVPLCQMKSLPEVVRHFTWALTNKDGNMLPVTPAIESSWNEHWVNENAKFEAKISVNANLRVLRGMMFYVWDGNHRLAAWKEFIETEHGDDASYYEKNGSPYCMVLDIPQGRAPQVVNAMHDVNLPNEISHVKTNLMHHLDRVRTFGSYLLEYYKPLISDAKYQECLNRRVHPWYPLNIEMMVSFLYAEDIAQTAEEAMTLYKLETPLEDQRGLEIQRWVDSAVAKEKSDKAQWFGKLAAVANPALGNKFLEEVS